MLQNDIVRKVEEFVYLKPRSIQEIAVHIAKNWRTADRYVKEIESEYGTISTRTFREGTRGALKIVYWSSIEKVHHSVFQERLIKDIEISRDKREFHAFDIFQHVPDKNKEARVEYGDDESSITVYQFEEQLLQANKQLLIFSGNLSFINFQDKNSNVFKAIEKLVKKGIKIKVICRVDISGEKNIERLLSLNFKFGKDMVEVRHSEQPLRATIIDDKILSMKETREPTGRLNELDKRIFIFYTIKDKEWISWITKLFWNMFANSIDANKRLEELKKIKRR